MTVGDQGSDQLRSEAISLNGRDASAPIGRVTGNSTSDRALITEAMAQLSAEDRAVVLRSHYQSATTAQIAAELAMSEDTVKSRLHFALRDLQQSLRAMGWAR